MREICGWRSLRGATRTAAAAIAAAGLFAGCSARDEEPTKIPGAQPSNEAATNDLPGIRAQGALRILVQRRSEGWLPRRGSPLDADRDRAAALAEDLGLVPVFVAIEEFGELIPALLNGRGDLVVENLTATNERRERVAFSLPVSLVRELVVARADDPTVGRPEDLVGRTLSVQPSSSFWETAASLAERFPGLQVEAAPEDLDIDGLLDGVASGRFDLTLMDSNVMGAALEWRHDLRVALDLGEDRVIAWAMRPDAVELRKAVDGFLAQSGREPATRGREIFTGDLDAIRERGVLRVITRNSSSTYFISRGELVGFEYDLARRFASESGLRLEMIVPPSRDDMLPWLRRGKGDIVAAGLTTSPERAAREKVRFSRKYHEVQQTVVTRSDEAPPTSLDALAGRTFAVRRSSAYWPELTRLREAGSGLELIEAPEQYETEEIIARVAAGEYDVTLADSHILAIERSWRDDVHGTLAIGEPIAHGWAVREGNAQLLEAIDAFFEKEYRGLFYNVTRKKYFGNPKAIRRRVAARPDQAGWISPYDDLVRTHARRYGHDWRMVVAQMYQESRFDPKARSFAGARGLLQVMPRTAKELGYENLEDPETGIEAGLDYLHWVRERFPPTLPTTERTWLTLAAYNVGFGHVRDAQRIARERGWDGDRWFGNVEQAMLLKERPEVHKHTRFGYARGREPVAYVRNIRDRYAAYVQTETAGD